MSPRLGTVCFMVLTTCSVTVWTEQDCIGLECKNGGIVQIVDELCSCNCPFKTSGLFCEYVLQESVFPDGSYALPMSIDGCPEGASRGWGQGYINITTTRPLHNPLSFPAHCRQPVIDRLFYNRTTKIIGPFGVYSLQMNFCLKSNKHPFNNSKSWPTGEYGLFRTMDNCPYEFSEHEMKLCLPPLLHYNVDGELPDFNIQDLVNSTDLRFRFCQRLSVKNADKANLPLRSINPFLAIKGHDKTFLKCPSWDGYKVNDESFPFALPTTILDQSTSDASGMFPLRYCHFRPEQYGLPSKKNENGFPIGHRVSGITEVFNPCWNQMNAWCKGLGEWLMIDARKTVLVSAVMILHPVSGGDITRIYVSDMKWSFINGGALWCRLTESYHHFYVSVSFLENFIEETVQELLPCYRSQRGRYITLYTVGKKSEDLTIYESYDVGIFSYNATQVTEMLARGDRNYSSLPELAMMLNNTDLSSERCNQELGMIDRGIADSQITASSWQLDHPPTYARPQHQGWCSAEDDTEPYIQIDLRFVTSVDGVRLYYWYNLVETVDKNVRMKTVHVEGAAAFHIEYGRKENSLTGKLQILRYDRSQPLEDPQTFLLVNPILARFIRFFPKPFAGNNRTCMKFELLGCKTSDLVAIQCSDNRHRMAINASSVFLPSNKPSKILSNTSQSSCRSYCLYNTSDCVALQYNTDERCTLYTANDNKSYSEYFHQPDYLNVLCISERPNWGSWMLERDWVMSAVATQFNITKTGYFTSPGFPITYPYDALFRWTLNLSLPVGTHVGVQFTNLSLRLFKEDDKCHDSVKLIISSSGGGVKDEYIWTSNDNGQTPSFDFAMQSRYHETVYIEFDTCSSGNLISDGKGFRALVFDTERKPCLYTMYKTTSRSMNCTVTQSELIAASFLGNVLANDVQINWKIYTGDYIIMTIRIIELETICSLGSSLAIVYGHSPSLICNENRPYGVQTYFGVGYFVEIMSSYTATPMPGINQRLHISYHLKHAESYSEDEPISKVCSTQFGKCYTISTATDISWKDVAENCRKRSTSLVTLKTDEEFRFVRSLIMTYYQLNKPDLSNSSIQIYIGLFSFTDSSGKPFESWFDGSSPTYTAWDIDQPFRRHILQCTKIQMWNLNVTNSWSSCLCDEKFDLILAVCERKGELYIPLEKMSPPSNYSELPLRRDPVTLFHCSSGEWMSRLVVCNGIAECFDASDETYCIYNGLCDEDEFRCADGACIHVSEACDYKFDCADKSDEFCVYLDCKDQFKCDNGQCISTDERCDSVKHCKDGSDEINCDVCNSQKAFHCILSRTCISKRLVCDKFEDCPSGTDEQQCSSIHFDTCIDLWSKGQSVSGYYKVKSGKHIILSGDHTPQNMEWYYSENTTLKVLCSLPYAYHRLIDVQTHRNQWRYTSVDWTDVDFVKLYKSSDPKLHFRYMEKSDIFNYVYRVESNNHTIGVDLIKPVKPGYIDGYIIDRGDIICSTTVPPDEPKYVFCREGIAPVSTSHRCLYERDMNGYVTGCRTLEHLNNCDNVVCPELYSKCPRSYCIPLMYVCDGNSDCAYGEDELLCDCPEKPPADIVILAAVGMHERALQLAGMLYSPLPKHRVRILNKVTHDNTLIGTEILSDTKHSSKANISYFYKDVGELFKESEGIRTLIVIAEDSDTVEMKLFLSITNLLSEQTNLTYKLHNVTIAKASNRLIVQRESLKGTEIFLKDKKIIATKGPAIFPELCNGMLNCSGMYRCRLSKVCIPQNQVCDHTSHCPYGDDEDHCDFFCPSNCSCDLLIVNCSNVQTNGDFNLSVSTRVLDISHSQSLANVLLKMLERNLTFPSLLRLNASWCGLNSINTDVFRYIPNLISLDLSHNNFSDFKQNMFINLKSLKLLFLTGNTFLTSIDQGTFNGLQLKSLTITGAKLFTLQANTFAGSSLTSLYIVGNDLKEIDDFAFNGSTIEVLNIDENSINTFGKNIFNGVVGLKHLTTPAYKFCCLRPMQLAEEQCLPLKDEFSSCRDLMRNTALQALLWTIGLLAMFGNMFSLFYRLKYDRQKMKLGYGIFVTNLAFSDLLMGIYMLIIAVADTFYRDRYIEHGDYWRNSGWCKFAGILSTLSSEGSVLFLFFITLDRIFVVKFPFGQIRFRTKTAMLASITVWIAVLLIAILPVVYVDYFQNRFYSKTGVCLALPLTRDKPPGWLYSILIFIVFNMIAFILIAVGQWLIFLEIKKNSMTKGDMNVSRRENDLKVARNLLLVVTTDFACWFPVCTMGLMALSGHVIPGEVYAWTAVLILPVNSALNPFLYTISAIYGAKKFTPSEDEQSYTRVNTEVGKEILNVLRDVLTNKATPRRRRRQLDDLLKYRSLTAYEATLIIYQVARLLNNLHENGLVFKDIVKEDIWLDTSKNGRIKRIRVDATRGLVLSPKKADFRENVLKLGHLADFLLERIDSTCL